MAKVEDRTVLLLTKIALFGILSFSAFRNLPARRYRAGSCCSAFQKTTAINSDWVMGRFPVS